MKSAEKNSEGKRFVGTQAAGLIQDGMVCGIGTGSTMAFLIEEVARRVRQEGLRMIGVPTSFQSRLLCGQLGIPFREIQDMSSLDLAIDGADEVDPALNAIKGGGAAHTREKIVASMAKAFVLIVDESKLVAKLGTKFPVPIEVLPQALPYVSARIRAMGGDPILRMGIRKDGPVISDNGQFILDARFAPTADLRAIDRELHAVPGVIETGLFFDLARKVLAGCGEPGTLSLKTLERTA
jgi:ribose 5-phosphate isomerase A